MRLSAASTSSYRVQAIDRGRRSLLSPITAFGAPREFNPFPVRQTCHLGKLDRDYRSCPRPLRFRQLMSCVTDSALKFAPLGQRIVRTC